MSKFCSSCGSQLEDNQSFCTNCGAPQNDNSNTTNQVNNQPAPQQPTPAQPTGQQPKSKLVAGLLGIFLGSWGIHNFYLGYTQKAVIQIVVTMVTCGLGGLWGVIEGILILCGNINVDADGNPLGD